MLGRRRGVEEMKRHAPYILLIFGLAVLDQFTKVLVASKVYLYESVPVIRGFFNLTRIHNKGAIFGFFSNSDKLPIFVLLTGASFCALALVVYYFVKTPPAERYTKTALSLILAGALGNLFDRLLRGYVIDFLDFYLKRWHWPFFNVADSCITVGAVLLVAIFFRRKPECSPSS
jgi:signal peptidase II